MLKITEKNVCKDTFCKKVQLFKKRKSPQFLYLWDFENYLLQHCLYFSPLPHGVETAIFLHFLQFFYRNYKEFIFSTTKICLIISTERM